jgi:recombination protein RecA
MAKSEKTTDTVNNSEKFKALKLTMDKIEKDYGKGSVMMMGDKAEQLQEVISTGSLGLDVALAVFQEGG